MVLRIQGATILAIVVAGCVAVPRPYPWNFPDEQEWNAPLQTSWLSIVDSYRNITAPKGKIWNPIVREYEPDFGYELELLKILPPDVEEHEMYQ